MRESISAVVSYQVRGDSLPRPQGIHLLAVPSLRRRAPCPHVGRVCRVRWHSPPSSPASSGEARNQTRPPCKASGATRPEALPSSPFIACLTGLHPGIVISLETFISGNFGSQETCLSLFPVPGSLDVRTGDFASQGTLGDVWRHSGLSRRGEEGEPGRLLITPQCT